MKRKNYPTTAKALLFKEVNLEQIYHFRRINSKGLLETRKPSKLSNKYRKKAKKLELKPVIREIVRLNVDFK